MNQERGSFFDRAPIMEFPPQVFDQPASFSPQLKKMISIKEYIAAKMPKEAATLGFTTDLQPEQIKDIYELTDLERRNLAIETYKKSGDDYTRLTVIGRVRKYTFTNAEVIKEIQKGSQIGQELVEAHIHHILFQLQLVKAGKIRIVEDADPSNLPQFQLPPFPF